MKYTHAQRVEAVQMVLEQGFSLNEVDLNFGTDHKQIRRWFARYQEQDLNKGISNIEYNF